MNIILDYPTQYLGFFYVMLYGFWLIKENKAILFWLYLWQLKEYHWGRFLDHFSTSKGKRIFLNPVFGIKVFLLAAALLVYAFIRSSAAGAYFFSPAFSLFFSVYYSYAVYFFSFSVFLIFAAEAAWTAISFFKRSVIHPVLTKKSLILTAITHLAAFCLVVLLYQMILGEMGLFDFSSGAFALLFFDLTTPLFVGLAVAILHPITVFEKNKILRKAEEARRARPDLFAIGIAGSYGKSITKELLAYVLLKKHRVLKTAANQNTEVGVSQVLINELKPEHEFFVCEIGAVHKGKIKSVADAVQPQAGILCGINQQHMAVFGNQQKIIDAKYEILEALPSNGAAILNWESKLIRESFESQKSRIKAQKIILAGKDIVVNDLKISIDRLTFKVKHADETAILDINARGAYFIEPILLAMAGALACKMNFQEIADILNKTDFTPFNIGLEKNSDGINILSSTYSANPNGVLAHLDYLKVWPGKKAIVMPCLIELGKSSKDVHRLIGKKIAGVCDFAVIVTRDRFGEIQKGAVLAGMKKEKIIFSEKPAVIKKIVTEILKPDGTLLLEGRLPQAIIEVLKS